MKVILLEELKGRGGEGDVIEVAQGFAVNFLLPKNIAIKATPGNLKQLKLRKHNIEKREVVRLDDANAAFEALDGKRVVIRAKVGDDGQLFGSVTSAHIASALLEQYRVEVDRKKIDLKKPIKSAGEHDASVSIYRELRAPVSGLVVKESASDEEIASLISGEDAEAAAGEAAAAEGSGDSEPESDVEGAETAAADAAAETSDDGTAAEPPADAEPEASEADAENEASA